MKLHQIILLKQWNQIESSFSSNETKNLWRRKITRIYNNKKLLIVPICNEKLGNNVTHWYVKFTIFSFCLNRNVWFVTPHFNFKHSETQEIQLYWNILRSLIIINDL